MGRAEGGLIRADPSSRRLLTVAFGKGSAVGIEDASPALARVGTLMCRRRLLLNREGQPNFRAPLRRRREVTA